MPKVMECPICGKKSSGKLRFKDRMSWLKRHYKQRHPSKSREGIMRVKKTDKK